MAENALIGWINNPTDLERNVTIMDHALGNDENPGSSWCSTVAVSGVGSGQELLELCGTPQIHSEFWETLNVGAEVDADVGLTFTVPLAAFTDAGPDELLPVLLLTLVNPQSFGHTRLKGRDMLVRHLLAGLFARGPYHDREAEAAVAFYNSLRNIVRDCCLQRGESTDAAAACLNLLCLQFLIDRPEYDSVVDGGLSPSVLLRSNGFVPPVVYHGDGDSESEQDSDEPPSYGMSFLLPELVSSIPTSSVTSVHGASYPFEMVQHPTLIELDAIFDELYGSEHSRYQSDDEDDLPILGAPDFSEVLAGMAASSGNPDVARAA